MNGDSADVLRHSCHPRYKDERYEMKRELKSKITKKKSMLIFGVNEMNLDRVHAVRHFLTPLAREEFSNYNKSLHLILF